MSNREFCMLASTYNAEKNRVSGMYLSEKLDGMRCLWLPHTRDHKVKDIPFANMEKDKREHVATGLWSRYGKVIHCPPEWVEGWPDYPLDGELYIGRGTFQHLMSAVRTLIPDVSAWAAVQMMVFDSPSYIHIFRNGRINNTNFKHTMNFVKVMAALGNPDSTKPRIFDFNYRVMERDLRETPSLKLHKQRLLPFNTDDARKIVEDELERVTSEGGEGLMLRHPASEWEPIRSEYLMKIKKLQDAEGIVLNYRAGEGKYLGMLGSLTVRSGDMVFELSGFTDEERLLVPSWSSWATDNPGKLLSDSGFVIGDNPCPAFSTGCTITYRFREHTLDGIPKEARYLRKRDESV